MFQTLPPPPHCSLTSSCETSETHDALLGCQDRSIRVVRDGENISTLGVDVCVTSLGCIDKNNEPVQNHKRVVFGTSSGTVAMLRIDGDGAGSHGWAVPSSGKVRMNYVPPQQTPPFFDRSLILTLLITVKGNGECANLL